MHTRTEGTWTPSRGRWSTVVIRSIATEHGVSRATVNRIARAAGLPERKRGPARRPERWCACGVRTTSKVGMCPLCKASVEVGPVDAADGLPEGAWTLDRRARVMRWEAA